MTMMARGANSEAIPALYPGTSQKVNFTSTPAQSAAVGADTTCILLQAQGADCRVRFGENPTPEADDLLCIAGIPYFWAIKPGEKIGVVRDASTDGTLNITEGANF